jgi:hypothetical protein
MNHPVSWPITYRFTGDNPVLAREFSILLTSRGFVPASDDGAGFTIHFSRTGEAPVPESQTELIVVSQDLSVSRHAERILFGYQSWHMALDLTTFTIRCTGPDPDPSDCYVFREAFLLWPVLFVMHRFGHFELHAAACAHHGSGYLLLGPSGSGKTTAVLSLIRAGWSYLSDDSTVMFNSSQGGVLVRALRRSFSLKPDHFKRHPELAGCVTECVPGTDKRRFDPSQLWPQQYAAVVSPAFVIACTVAEGQPTRITPISRAESLARLVGSAPFLMFDQAMGSAHLEILRALAAKSYSFELKAGRDLLDDSDRIASLFAPEVLMEKWLSVNRNSRWA